MIRAHLYWQTERLKRIPDTFGTWLIKEIPEKKDLFILGGYNGLFILKKENNSWILRNKIKGFDISSRHSRVC